MDAFCDELSKIASISGNVTSALVGAVLLGSGSALLQRPSGQTDRLLTGIGRMTPDEQKSRSNRRVASSLAVAGVGAIGASMFHQRIRQAAAKYVQDVVTPSVERSLVRAEEVGRVMSKQVAEDVASEIAKKSPAIGKGISEELSAQALNIGKEIGDGAVASFKSHLPGRPKFFR